MNNSELTAWTARVLSEGRAHFAADIVAFPYELAPAPTGMLGSNDTSLVTALGVAASWLSDPDVQDRLSAIFYYQKAARCATTLAVRSGKAVVIRNPLIGAALAADADGASSAVTMLLADAARAQHGFLEFRRGIPEWCDKRIFELSSICKRDFAWLPADPRRARRRASAIRASMRR